ncbi:MAG: DNA internalization-related competence protein ComEC/Rec2 [Nitrospirae bacterium]|nr:DNA internalization-related competence protein ComEC/Rec2 [Nitrospirota bacterium]
MTRFPLLWVATAFIAGISSGDLFFFYPLLTASLLSLLFFLESFFSFLRITFPQYIVLFLFFWGGFLALQWTEGHTPKNDISRWIGQNVIYTGVIDETVAHYKDHTSLILKTMEVETDGQTIPAAGKIKLNINRAVSFSLSYGDRIKVPLILREPHGFQNPNSFDYGKYLTRHGFRAIASLTHPEDLSIVGKNSGLSILKKVYEWREEIRGKAMATLTGEPLAIFLAIVIGESGYLTNEIRDYFMASGTTHILSISGSHLALVAFLVFQIAKFLLLRLPEPLLLNLSRFILPSKLALAFSIPPVLLYGLLAGNQVATNRSMIMIVVFLIGQFLNREQSLFNPLALSALVILLWDPLQIYDISFQLSFGSVLSISLVLDRLNQKSALFFEKASVPLKTSRFNKLRRLKITQNTKNYLWISLGTSVGTAPLVAYHFNQFNWVGLLANSVIIPLVGFAVVPIALISSFLSLAFNASFLYFEPLNRLLFTWFYKIVKWFSAFPYAEIHLASPPLFQIILFFTLILILLYGRLPPKKKALGWTLAFLVPFWWHFGPRIHPHAGKIEVTILDVGQGDSSYIEFPDGKNMLIDGGGRYHEFDVGRLVVAPFLWNRGIRRLDYLVATHPQNDHIGGLIYILKKFEVGEVWTNGKTEKTQVSVHFEKMIQDRHLNEKVVDSDDHLKMGEIGIMVFNPHLKDPVRSSARAKENNDGIVIKIDYHRHALLFTADIEKEAEERILFEHPGLTATFLKVPHHGGKSSADPAFIRSLSPEISVFSAGRHNAYHHPNPDTIALYQTLHTRIYRTDQDGALIFKTDGNRYEAMTAVSLIPKRVPLGKEMLNDELQNLFNLKQRF